MCSEMAEAPGPSDDVPAPKRRKVMKKAKKGSTKHPKEPRPEDQDKEETSDSANPLLFFFHMKTTGYDIYKDHIIQIGAKVIGEYASYAKEQEFSCLVNTDRPIHPSGNSFLNSDALHVHTSYREKKHSYIGSRLV